MTKESSSYAYNISGIAYDHSLLDADLPERIVVSSLSSKPLSDQPDPVIPLMSPSPEELAVADRRQSVVMLIRLLPQNAADFNPKALNDKRRESGQRKRAREET